jgi:hypothetical protein
VEELCYGKCCYRESVGLARGWGSVTGEVPQGIMGRYNGNSLWYDFVLGPLLQLVHMS